jgi:HEAT repeat protein
VSNTVKQPRQTCSTKYLLFLKFAFLGFVVPIVVVTSPAMPQTTPSISPKASQSATPQSSPSAELKKSEELTSAEDKKKPDDGEKLERWVLFLERWLLFGASGLTILAVVYLLVLWLNPRLFLKIPPNLKTPKLGPIPEISISHFAFLLYRDRVLDAWVSDRIEKAREEFDRRQTVEERKIHISMPVVLDGKTVTGLMAKDLGKTCSKQEFRLLIWGEGGAGKTHLACLIAKWAMAEQKEERLCSHRMLPVLIEEELEEPKDTSTNKSPLLDAVTRQLKNLRDEEKPIPEELLKKLLEKRRVLVVVDHLSEMSEATRKAIRLRDASFPVNALVVTSRLEDILGKEVTHTLLKPMRVDGKQLSIFMDDYLKAKGKRELFEDDQYFEYLRRLSQIVTDTRKITLLFAKLYADQMIAVAEGQLSDELPKNVPDLMLSYVNELNQNVREGKLEDATVQQNLKLIAWECMRQTFKPETADRQEVLTRLAALVGEGEAAKETAKQHLKYLEERLSLIRTVKPANQRLRVLLDPLAEYLAGLYLVEHYRNDVEAWRSFLAEAAEKPGTLEEIRGFLLALRECCPVNKEETKVPSFVAEELGRLAGLDLEALEQEQLNRRIQYLISALSRPDAEDRAYAAKQIGNIGSAAKVAVPVLIKTLKDSDFEVRSCASEALCNLGSMSKPELQELLTLLKDRDHEVRSTAYETLVALNDTSIFMFQGLLTLLGDNDSSVRSLAVNVVSELGDTPDPVLQALLILLKEDDDYEVCSTVAEALVKLGIPSEPILQVQDLLVLLEDGDSNVQSVAAQALGKLGDTSEPVLEGLVVLLEDGDPNVRCSSAEALGMLKNGSEPVLERLLMLLEDDVLRVRYEAVKALVSIGYVNEDVISVLEAACQDTNSWFRRAAKKILDRITNQENSAED